MARFVVFIYGDEKTWDGWSEDQQRVNADAHGEFNAFAGSAVVGGHELQRTPAATSVRADSSGDQVVTNGPFLRTEQVIGGFYLLEAATQDEAIDLAKRLPEASAPNSGVEIRPVAVD